ncbi:MAG: hypothetical protein ACOZHQ_09235 [Thermodesulfobacteriota bacterium]
MGEYEELRKSAECRYTPGALTGVSYINGEPFVSVNQDSLRQLVSDLDAARAEVSDLAQALADANTARDEARAERDALRAALGEALAIMSSLRGWTFCPGCDTNQDVGNPHRSDCPMEAIRAALAGRKGE